jgi:DNA polymerase III epsilon subunit-like protein
MADIYISADIEADGPIPGPFSMLSFGLAVASRFDGVRFEPAEPSKATFYRELKPISEQFEPKALAVTGLDRDMLMRKGTDPSMAMRDAAEWVAGQSGGGQPVLVGYPVVFDWMFLYWYFLRFIGQSPFGFSKALDMKTIFQQKAGVTLDRAGRTDLPSHLASTRRHTHNALDDAVEQAEIFNRLFVWEGVDRK